MLLVIVFEDHKYFIMVVTVIDFTCWLYRRNSLLAKRLGTQLCHNIICAIMRDKYDIGLQALQRHTN